MQNFSKLPQQYSGAGPVVVTNCTTRKRAGDEPVTLSPAAGQQSLSKLAKDWQALLRKARRPIPAGELYVGRSIAESKRAARVLGADLYIVSAGLGLIHESELVPHYDLTVGSDSGALKEALKLGPEPLTTWWALLGAAAKPQRSLAQLLLAKPRRLMLLALPASYLRLVAADLSTVNGKAAQRIRIFTSEAGRTETPPHLRRCVLPYDDRLESIAGFNGTRAEFPQRALRHFVEDLRAQHLTLRNAHKAVELALADRAPRTLPTRQRQNDDEIIQIIRSGWATCAGSSTRLLRYVRDEASVSCEQSRFRALWHHVRAEHQARD